MDYLEDSAELELNEIEDSYNSDAPLNLEIEETNVLLSNILIKLDEIYIFFNEKNEHVETDNDLDELSEFEEKFMQFFVNFETFLEYLNDDEDENLFNEELFENNFLDDEFLLTISQINENISASLGVQKEMSESIDIIEESSLLSATYLLVFVPFVFVTYYIYSLFKNFIVDYY